MCGHIAATREARDTDTIEVDLRGSLGKLADRGNMVLKVRCSVRSAVGRGSERLLAVRRTPPIENQYPSTERREMHRVDKGERAKTPVGKTGMGDVVDLRAAIDESKKGIEIGRAECRERVCKYGWIWGVAE